MKKLIIIFILIVLCFNIYSCSVPNDKIERKIDQIRLSTCPTPGGAEADHIANERNQLDRIGYKLDEIKKYLPWIAKGLYPMNLDFLEIDNPKEYIKDLLEQHKKWRNK